MKRNVEDGTPVNPPVWWADPSDENALKESTAFLLGDEVLAAPVLDEGQRERDVYLPRGDWRDGNRKDKVYRGPVNIDKYPAPLDVLPFFVRVGSDAEKILLDKPARASASTLAASLLVTCPIALLSIALR